MVFTVKQDKSEESQTCHIYRQEMKRKDNKGSYFRCMLSTGYNKDFTRQHNAKSCKLTIKDIVLHGSCGPVMCFNLVFITLSIKVKKKMRKTLSEI